MDLIYLDNNATTPMLPQAWEAMRPYFIDHSGNPASSHRWGRQARQALEDARERIAVLLQAEADEVLFTSGATEANNLALFGLAGTEPGHILVSPIEHPSVSEPIQRLVGQGFSYSQLPVSETGIVGADLQSLRPDMRLVTLMLANHEMGAIQPVEALASEVAGRVPFHCDAAAAVGKIPVSFSQLKATSLTISAHKFHGPKGIGALVVKKNAPLQPVFWGGHQQKGKRPGTEPVALAVGMATALEWAVREMQANHARVMGLRDIFLAKLRANAVSLTLNGSAEGGVPHTLNISFPGCPADVLLMKLDLVGVACSAGSACSSGSLLPSPVLRAMAVPSDVLHSALRFSFSPLLSAQAVEEAANRIAITVNNLRQRCQNH